MKIFKIFLVLVCGVLFTSVGCDKGPSGSTGPTGPGGSPAPNTFQASFQNGVFPTGAYAGEIDTWLNGGANTTVESGNAFRRIMTGASPSNYGRILLTFNVSTLPVNAQVISAEVILTSQTTTSVSTTPVTIGIHNLASSLIPSCIWTINATWAEYNGSTPWSACDSDISAGQTAMYIPTAMSTVVFTNTANGKTLPYRWTISPSVIQAWLAGNNNGLVLRSEGEFGEPTASIDFYPYNDATASNHATLLVTYQ